MSSEVTALPHAEDAPQSVAVAILAVQKDIDAIGKDRQAGDGAQFTYRGIDDVINALHPLFVKHGMFIAPRVVEQTHERLVTLKRNGHEQHNSMCRIIVEYDAHTATDSIACVTRAVGWGVDTRDKAPGIAMSYAWRTAMQQLFTLPTDDPTLDAEYRNDDAGRPAVDMNRLGRMFAAYQLLPETSQQTLANWLKQNSLDLDVMASLHEVDIDRLDTAIDEHTAAHVGRHGEQPETGHTEEPF